MRTLVKLFKLIYELRDSVKRLEQTSAEISMIKETKYLTPERAALYTGLSERTIRDLVAQKMITVCRPTSNRAFISKDSLDLFMSKNPLYSTSESKAIANAKVRKSRR